MTQHVQELIDKIKKEGILESEAKAKDIMEKTQAEARTIIEDAKKKVEKLMADAEADRKRNEDATHRALKQASRDMLLHLREKIESLLKEIISAEIKEALTSEHLVKMIEKVAQGYLAQDKDVKDITVVLSKEELKKLEKGFIGKLQEKIKQPIVFEGSEDVAAGFTISFDKGRSFFDFSDASLAEFLSSFLNERVGSLLKESVAESS